jgi:transposase
LSLRPEPVGVVPEDTARVARAAFPRGTAWIRLRDELGTIYRDESFAPLFSDRGRPAEAPWRLALVSVMQFAERLSDRRAADAVRGRIDWKYALGLPLDDPGFDASVLCEFRSRLIAGSAEQQVLDALLAIGRERGWLRARGRQRTDSTHVLAAIRALNRVELVAATMRAALNALAEVAADWLLARAQPEWIERYARRPEDDRLPSKQAERDALVAAIGADGGALLQAVHADDAPAWLRTVPAVEVLRRVWVQNYLPTEHGLRWRTAEDGLPPSVRFISSPFDPEAHYARKRTTSWIGYKAHLTETCEPDAPHLVTHVETTPAPLLDFDAVPRIHGALAHRDLLPGQHLVDAGYIDADLLVESRRAYGVDLFGPPKRDPHWQAAAGRGYAAQDFVIDWPHQRAICPQGKPSLSWTPAIDNRHNAVVKIKFSARDCRPCPVRADCTRSRKRSPRRTLTVRREAQFLALRASRDRTRTAAYAAEYARRAGAEGTISQGVRACGLRRSRYAGQAKTHLDHVLTAAALNCRRLSDWLAQVPRATTRRALFVRLLASAS